ncbi:hypothetical protein MP228_002512 [Amoeboaphelidium protococcarum]|nr:hypothetical protein MP228_002512 [Amoeboaphelidium protococcarum]
MGRFSTSKQSQSPYIARKAQMLMEEDDPNSTQIQGFKVAERGILSPRRTSVFKKIQSSLALSAQRLAVFKSPEYKRHRDEAGIAEADVTVTPMGLLRTALDPQFRESRLGDRWRFIEGCNDKTDAAALFDRADTGTSSQQTSPGSQYHQQQQLTNGGSKLRHFVTAEPQNFQDMLSHSKYVKPKQKSRSKRTSSAAKAPLRRSKRLRNKQLKLK